MSDIKLQGDGPMVSVDDDDGFRCLIKFAHTRSSLPNELVLLRSGIECLEYLTGVMIRGEPCPSIILMDVNMPGMDGFDTVRRIRQLEAFAEVPVVCMLSSSNSTKDIRLTKECGANWYFEKPFDLLDLPIFRPQDKTQSVI